MMSSTIASLPASAAAREFVDQEDKEQTARESATTAEPVADSGSAILDLVLKLWVAIVIGEGLGALPSDFSRSSAGGQPMQAGRIATVALLVGAAGVRPGPA